MPMVQGSSPRSQLEGISAGAEAEAKAGEGEGFGEGRRREENLLVLDS